ncbi:hypothetical protein M3226_26365 [Neobacillus cucumis]|uniref:hypothetical protein n=1 Tax=Neobacillus cucumis TaxID=1740721 RepID=UPI002041EC9B|nr:hypothetical protein [Neobacillus cucumis]MCM3729140.1 hypothetical protein [Neobacillus cucumis]
MARAISPILKWGIPPIGWSGLFVNWIHLVYITLKTNSAELSIGAHAADNMLLGWFLPMDDSALGKIPSFFVVTNINPAISLMWTIVSLGIFFFISLRKYNF